MSGFEYLFAIFVCLGLSAFFSSSETALLRLKPEDLEEDINKTDEPAVMATKSLIQSTSKLLVTILLGNNVVNIFGAACASALAVLWFGPKMGLFISTFVMTALVLIFSEVIPKAFAARSPKTVAYFVSMPLYLIHKLSFPIHWLFDKYIDPWISKMVGGAESENQISTEDLIRQAGKIRQGKLDGSPIAIIGSAARAGDLMVGDIMIPKARVFSASIDERPSEILKKMFANRYSRIPIYQGSVDSIQGVLHLRDLARSVSENSNFNDLKSLLRPVIRVPERTPILATLTEMQKKSIHMAIVKDEFSETSGILTHEDILEELVGEIRDEFDQVELKSLRKIKSGEYEASADLLVHDFNRETGWDLNFERGDTLNSLLINSLNRLAKPGDICDIGEYQIQVFNFRDNRPSLVRVIQKK